MALQHLSPLGLKASGFVLDSIGSIVSSFTLRPGSLSFEPPDSPSVLADPSHLTNVLSRIWRILTALDPLSLNDTYSRNGSHICVGKMNGD
jgi:hypothetical protein